jgi:hypothetical protein
VAYVRTLLARSLAKGNSTGAALRNMLCARRTALPGLPASMLRPPTGGRGRRRLAVNREICRKPLKSLTRFSCCSPNSDGHDKA